MRWTTTMVVIAGCALGACKNEAAGPNPFGGPDGDPEIPDWIDDAVAAESDACSSSPFWEDAAMATTFFAGSFVFNGEAARGQQQWILYPNPRLTELLDFQPCRVVWDSTGAITDPMQVGTYGLTISGVLNEELTDCTAEDTRGQTIYAGQESLIDNFDILEANGMAQVFLSNGEQLGEGESDENGLTYLSDRVCQIF
jgi:hypothetical protein